MTGTALDLYLNNNGWNVYSAEMDEYWDSIEAGVGDPDEEDAVYGNDGTSGALTTITHFFDPDDNVNAPMEFSDPLGVYDDDYPNAWNAARTFWSRALGEYAAGDKAQAYRYLGSVAHFLGDQSIPTHAHSDTHGPDWLDDDAYEEWMSVPADGGGTSPNAVVTDAEFGSMVLDGLLDPLPGDPNASVDDQLLWLFLNVNQTADYFASDDVDGDAVHPSDPRVAGWAQGSIDRVVALCAVRLCPTSTGDLADNDGAALTDYDNNNDDDGDLSTIREISYLYGIRGIAALFALWEDAISSPILTLSVHRMAEVGDNTAFGTHGMDDYGSPDLYAGVVMGENDGLCELSCDRPIGAYLEDRRGDTRTIDGEIYPSMVTRYDSENKNENETNVYPDYHFGRVFPAAASGTYAEGVDEVFLDLSIWDQDDDPTTGYDPYEVDEAGALYGADGALTIGVDLAKCQAGASDAVGFNGLLAPCSADPNVTASAGLSGGYIAVGLHGTDNSDAVHAEFSVSISEGSLCQKEDTFEENDFRWTAYQMLVPRTLDAYTCDGDDDWYSLPVEAGQTVTAEAWFENDDGDIDIELYGPTGTWLNAGTTTTDYESASAPATATGLHFVRVFGYEGAANHYRVGMSRSLCPSSDDGLEPNDLQAAATPIAHYDVVTATFCGSEESWDYYSFDAVAGDVIDIDLAFEHDDGNLDMQLCLPACTTYRTSLDDDEHFTSVATSTGTHYIGVYSPDDADNLYELSLSTAPCPFEDSYEDDDTQAEATPVGEQARISATTCDDDWYSFDVTDPFSSLTALGTFDAAIGEVGFTLHDSAGALVTGFSIAGSGRRDLTRELAPGSYAVRVAGISGAKVPYTLDMQVGLCPYDDDLEDNDTQATAIAWPGSIPQSSCDPDFFSVPVSTGDYLTADLAFVHDDGDVNVYVLDPNGAFVAMATSATDDECLTVQADQTGDYAVAVVGDANTYRLTVDTGATPTRLADDESSLDFAIRCFNAAPAGAYAIDLVADIDLTEAIRPIDNPNGATLMINGGGYTVDGGAGTAQPRECAIPDPPYTIACSGPGAAGGFSITAGDTVDIDSITVTNAWSDDGGAIHNAGTTTLSNSVITGNLASNSGGGLYNSGGASLTVLSSEISSNTAAAAGGGGILNAGDLTVTASSIRGNTAVAGPGGGGISSGGGTATIAETTISGNEAQGAPGGGLTNGGTMLVANSTLSGNSSTSTGGAVYNSFGTLSLVHTTVTGNGSSFVPAVTSRSGFGVVTEVSGSIIADNTWNAVALSGGTDDTFVSGGFNVIGDVGADVTAFTEIGDLVAQTGVGLAPLAFNDGGATETHALDAGSVAVDHVTGAFTVGAAQVQDQNGTPRPVGNADAGAYERQCLDDAFEDNDTSGTATALANDVPVSGSVCSGDDDWFSLPAVSGQLVTAIVDFVHVDGDLDIQLFDPAGEMVDVSNGVVDGEAITWTAESTGTFLLAVYGFNDAQNDYSVLMRAGTHPRIRPFGVVAAEGDTGSTIVDAVVYLEDEEGEPYVSPTPVTATFFTSDIPSNPRVAHPGSDFVATTGTVTFQPGETTAFVPIEILGDTIDEEPLLYGEWGLFGLNTPSQNAKIDVASFFGIGLVIILDDD